MKMRCLPAKHPFIITLLMLLVVACGAAATATPAPTSEPRPVGAAPTPSPIVAAVATPAPKAAPTSAPAPVPAAKVNPGKLVIMMGNLSTERFDPTFSSATGGTNHGRILGGFLISGNERAELLPGIATKWDIAGDGKTWTFTIRKGVKFHDRSELTAQDVLWTHQHTFGPQAVEYILAGRARGVATAMDRIELSGPDQVSLTTKTALSAISFTVAEAGSQWYHILPKRAKLRDTEEEAAYDKNPIGAGPMRLVKHVPAYVMKYERFDDYYYQPKNGFTEDKRVNFQSLDLLLVPEEATRVAAVRAGEADIVPASLQTRKQIEAGGGRLVFGQEGVVLRVRPIGCFLPQYPCRDKRVRQALDYAIDKELIRDRLYGGPEVFQVKGWAAVSPSTIGYTPELDPRPFDPAKARQLLADAGYPGGKGFGKLIVNTHPSTSMPFMVEMSELIAEFWRRQLGLDVEVQVGETVEMITRWRAGKLNGQILLRDDETLKEASGTFVTTYGDPKYDRRVHEEPELFRLAQETEQIVDPDKRDEASKKAFLRLRDESYELGLGYANIPWGVGPRILTWRPYPLALYPSALHTITLK